MVFERTTLSSLTKNFVFELSLDACGRDPTPEQLLHLQGQGKTQPILIPGADELSSQGYTPGSQAQGNLSDWVSCAVEDAGVREVEGQRDQLHQGLTVIGSRCGVGRIDLKRILKINFLR